jgi:peptidyl-prolyl cis-trans isomerase-like 1
MPLLNLTCSSSVLLGSLGKLTIELYWDHAPLTCRNFAELSRRGYYDNCTFHRLVPNFVIQGGDPSGTGRGGQSIYGRFFDDELHGDLKHTGAGILSMANAGPNVNGSQFFITLAPAHSLNGRHTIFGRIQSGMTTVQRISQVATDGNDVPLDPVVIRKAIVHQS